MGKGKLAKGRLCNSQGLSMIEVIAVLVIVGIIAALVVSRGIGIDESKMRAEVDTLKGHLRYAQYLAMNENEGGTSTPSVRWGIRVNGPNYTLIRYIYVDNSWQGPTSPFDLPNEFSPTHNFADGITAAVTGNEILFNAWGAPYSTAGKLNAPASILFSPGAQTIIITPETGFMP